MCPSGSSPRVAVHPFTKTVYPSLAPIRAMQKAAHDPLSQVVGPRPGAKPRNATQSSQQKEHGQIGIADAERARALPGLEQIEHEMENFIARLLPGKTAIGMAKDLCALDEIKEVRLFVEVSDDRGDHRFELDPRSLHPCNLLTQSAHELMRSALQQGEIKLFLITEIAV